jgi:putative ABC transport system substrate-binding protein
VDRRTFVRALGLAMAGPPRGAEAQSPATVRRVGYLTQGPNDDRRYLDAFLAALRDRGHVPGKTLVLEERYADGDNGRLPELAAELVRLGPEVIVALATPATQAAARATASIPIVTLAAGDPVGAGLVRSLAKPGGNVTGLAGMTPELAVKWLEILKETLPALSRVVVLWFPDNPVHARYRREVESSGRALALRLHPVDTQGLDAALSDGHRDDRALLVLPENRVFAQRAQLTELIGRHRTPAITMFREFAEAGFLITYGPNVLDLFRRAAGYVDRILRGARPADLPVEQPTTFDFSVNLRAAKALGLTIPPAVLARADEVIE